MFFMGLTKHGARLGDLGSVGDFQPSVASDSESFRPTTIVASLAALRLAET